MGFLSEDPEELVNLGRLELQEAQVKMQGVEEVLQIPDQVEMVEMVEMAVTDNLEQTV